MKIKFARFCPHCRYILVCNGNTEYIPYKDHTVTSVWNIWAIILNNVRKLDSANNADVVETNSIHTIPNEEASVIYSVNANTLIWSF